MGKILFIRGGAVGDFILTMPTLGLMREGLPDNEIEILGYPAITELATAAGLADRTRSLEDAGLAPFFAPGAALDEKWCDYLAGFDVVISYLYDPDGFFAGNLERAGVKTLLTGPFRPDERAPFVPAAVQLARPLERFALYLEDPAIQLDYGGAERSPLPAPSDRPRVAIHPGSGSASKNWSFESWAEILERLAAECGGLDLVVTSGEAESSVIDQFLALLEARGLEHSHLSGRSLTELGALYAGTDLYLGHDSGISHLAASTGIEGLLLFGPTNPAIWGPSSARVTRVLSPDRSLGGITVDGVWEALEPWRCSQAGRRE